MRQVVTPGLLSTEARRKTPGRFRSQSGMALIWITLLLALLRGFVAQGYMPGISHEGRPSITICQTVAGGAALRLAEFETEPASEPHATSDADCAYGFLATPFILPLGSGLLHAIVPACLHVCARVHRNAPAEPPAGPPIGSRAPPR